MPEAQVFGLLEVVRLPSAVVERFHALLDERVDRLADDEVHEVIGV